MNPQPDPLRDALRAWGADDDTRTALDRAEDRGFDGPEPDLYAPASDQECADAADRAVGGDGPW